jgi:phage gpG-like protein
MCREYPLVSYNDLTYARFGTNKAEIEKIANKYRLTAKQVTDTAPVMRSIADNLQIIFKRNFESQGRRKGGSWPALKQETIKHKLRLVGQGGGHRLQGGRAFGGGFFIRPKGSSGITGVFKPTAGALHVYEPVRLTDRLFNAATGQTSETVKEVTRYKAIVGVQGIPYAKVQRDGGGNSIPARNYMMVDEADRIEFLHLLEDHIFLYYAAGSGFVRRAKGLGGYVF